MKDWLADPSGTLYRGRLALVLAGITAVFGAVYISINVYSVGRPAHTLFLPGEERLPFLPVFEYLYGLTCLAPALLIVSVRTYPQFVRLTRAFAIALLVAATTYLVFPVYMERPHLEVDSLHTWLLSLHYLDKPYNHFPSMHVIQSWLVVFSAEGSRRFRIALALVAVGISVSTLFVKQHYIVDVVYGYLLAWGAWKLAGVWASKRVMVPTGASTASAAE
jgi:membrane-associated phospholipid phosphatase